MDELTEDDRQRIAEAMVRHFAEHRERLEADADAMRADAEMDGAIAYILSLPRATPNEQFPNCLLRADLN
jgi:TRAP-type C4-dicarboxylate transport system substrate-binding protein